MDSSDNLLSSTSEDNDVVSEWVHGLPTAEELIPLSQPLITPQLAFGFSVTPEPNKTILDVHRASQDTISTLRCRQGVSSSSSSSALKKFPSLTAPSIGQDGTLEVVDEEEEELGIEEDNTVYMIDGGEIGGSLATDDDIGDKGSSKRPRLVWTAQLHKRFVDVVKHLGIKNAVPKTIMQLMNVEGLTRENVASHLQKYRLYLKRINGVPSDDDTSPSHHPFTGTPVPQNMREAPAPVPMPVPVPYVMPPRVIPMPVYGLPHQGSGGGMGMISPNGQQLANGSYRGFAPQHPFAVFGPRPGGWPDGKQHGSNASAPDAAQSDR